MEYVEPALDIANCLGTPVCKYLQYHRKLNDYVRNFKRIRDELNCKMEDIELQLKAELLRPLGKIPKNGVQNWLKDVKKMIREAQVKLVSLIFDYFVDSFFVAFLVKLV
ncbi:hypothetical protein Gotur_026515 [Gossypium turneri]